MHHYIILVYNNNILQTTDNGRFNPNVEIQDAIIIYNNNDISNIIIYHLILSSLLLSTAGN